MTTACIPNLLGIIPLVTAIAILQIVQCVDGETQLLLPAIGSLPD